MGALSTAAPQCWYKADALALSDGAAISSWTDSSGGGYTATGGSDPIYKTGITPTGGNVARFASSYKFTSAPGSGSAQSIVAVIKPSGSGDRTIMGANSSGGLQLRVNSDGTLFLIKQSVAGIGSTGSAISTSAFSVIIATFTSATSWAIYVNGTVAASGSTAQTLTGGLSRTIGCRDSTVVAETFSGDMPELAAFTRVLSGTEITDITAEMQAKWITASTSGTVQGSLPHLTGSAVGTVTTTGEVAGSLPHLTGSAAGTVTTVGTVAGTLPSLTGSITGTASDTIAGTVAGTLPALTGSIAGDVTAPITGAVAGTLPSLTGTINDSNLSATIGLGLALEVGALTLADVVALPGTTLDMGTTLAVGTVTPVEVLAGTTLALGMATIARPEPGGATDPRTPGVHQWRYVITELDGTPLGELDDIEHNPVEDGVNVPTTMRLRMASDDPARTLIEAFEPMARKCQVWEGDQLLLWGPILPDLEDGDGTAGYTVHDPSWWWRQGRRVIGRFPRLDLLRNGDFRQGLDYWTRGFDADSIPAAAPTVTVISEDLIDDEDEVDPIKAARIVGVETVDITSSELASSAVFWGNRPFAWEPLAAGFRPGGTAAVDAVATAMPATAGLKVSIVGHTANDGTGSGVELSKRRALAAKARVQAIRPGAVITTSGVGYYQPNPAYAVDSQQQRRVVISYESTTTVTAQAKQWIRQTVSVSQPKSARYPLELTAAALVKVADDWSVEDANMTTIKVVARRGAATTPWHAQKGVASTSLSDTDPVERWLSANASVTIPADDRTYNVDVYLYAAAAATEYALVALWPEEMLYSWGEDQALIFKKVAEHIQDTALGHGDLNIETRTPLTGIKRDRTYPFREHMPADTALEEFASLNRGMDYDTLMLPDNRVILATYFPRQGQQTGYTLVQGGNIAAATPERSRDVASSIIMQSQDIGTYRAEAYARDSSAFGGLLLERVVTAEQGTPVNELRDAARQELAWGRSSTSGYWLDVDPDAITEVAANVAKGDTVRLILDHPRDVDRLVRIIGRERTPGSLRLLVSLEEV